MTEAIQWIPTDKRKALVKESEIWAEVAEKVSSFVVTDAATAAFAHDMAKQARAVYREKEEERKAITTPLLQAKNATDAYFRPTLEAVAKIKRHYEQAIATYDLNREQARAKVLVQSAAELSVGIVPTEPIPEPVHVESTSVRHVWEPEIVDEDLVPREFCSPDLRKIKEKIAYADTPHKAPHDIPGVRFVLKSIVVVR